MVKDVTHDNVEVDTTTYDISGNLENGVTLRYFHEPANPTGFRGNLVCSTPFCDFLDAFPSPLNKIDMITSILDYMVHYRDSAIVQEASCSFLIKVASFGDQEAYDMVRAGAHNVLKEICSRHKGNAAVEVVVNMLRLVLDEKSGRYWRESNHSRGKHSRSRSRIIEDGRMVRARANMNRSPMSLCRYHRSICSSFPRVPDVQDSANR